MASESRFFYGKLGDLYNGKMYKKIVVVALVLGLLVSVSGRVEASHSWGGYHWGRTSNPFSLVTADNLSLGWKPYLATTNSDWSASNVLDMLTVKGINIPKRCKATTGRVEVCNAAYGNNGWLGIAQIWISGGHITAGVTKLNDTYFSKSAYNKSEWKNLVMCQEVGHTLGLDHQDEVFTNANLGTCMDYSNDPNTNQHPNAHDYQQLEEIYGHVDVGTTVGSSLISGRFGLDVEVEDRKDWGRLVRESRGGAVYERRLEGDRRIVTHVLWADEERTRGE